MLYVSPRTCSSSHFLYICIWLVILLVISLFVTPKFHPAGAESTWKKYGAFLNSFHQEDKQLMQRFEQIKNKCVRVVIGFVISLFVPLKMAPVGPESTWEIHGTFPNSFHPKVKWLIWKLEVVQPYDSTDTATARKTNFIFPLSKNWQIDFIATKPTNFYWIKH